MLETTLRRGGEGGRGGKGGRGGEGGRGRSLIVVVSTVLSAIVVAFVCVQLLTTESIV